MFTIHREVRNAQCAMRNTSRSAQCAKCAKCASRELAVTLKTQVELIYAKRVCLHADPKYVLESLLQVGLTTRQYAILKNFLEERERGQHSAVGGGMNYEKNNLWASNQGFGPGHQRKSASHWLLHLR